MNKRFRLFAGEESDCQMLGMSYSLSGIPEEPEFIELVSDFGLAVAGVERSGRVNREVKLEPPIPEERLQEFGQALVHLARTKGCDSGAGNSILFIDNRHSPEPANLRERVLADG